MGKKNRFSDAIKLCEKIFSIFNNMHFDGMLATPEFCFSPSNYGTVDFDNVLCINDEFSYKVSIPTELLNDDICELAACILHNMIHIYGYTYDKSLCCSQESYHNKRFMDKASECGLEWTGVAFNKTTCPSDEFRKLCTELGLKKTWKKKYTATGSYKKKSSTRKYVDESGESVRATKKHILFLLDDCSIDVIREVQRITGKAPMCAV